MRWVGSHSPRDRPVICRTGVLSGCVCAVNESQQKNLVRPTHQQRETGRDGMSDDEEDPIEREDESSRTMWQRQRRWNDQIDNVLGGQASSPGDEDGDNDGGDSDGNNDEMMVDQDHDKEEDVELNGNNKDGDEAQIRSVKTKTVKGRTLSIQVSTSVSSSLPRSVAVPVDMAERLSRAYGFRPLQSPQKRPGLVSSSASASLGAAQQHEDQAGMTVEEDSDEARLTRRALLYLVHIISRVFS